MTHLDHSVNPASQRPLNVAHVIKGLGRGGAETLITLCARSGRSGNTYSAVYFVPWKDALVDDLANSGVTCHCLEARSAPALLARVPSLARWLKREQIDVVHAHLPLSGVAARLACRLASIPLVYTEHNLQERYHPLTRKANLLTWRLQSSVVAVSLEVARSIEAHAGHSVAVDTVLNGIDASSLDCDPSLGRAVRRRLRIPERAKILGTVAVFRPQKRLDLWLDVAHRLAASDRELHFMLVGDGPLRAELEQRARELSLPNVHFLGLQADVRPYLSAMDVFLMTSEFEGLPLALLEAMACRRAVVATQVGGIAEVAQDDAVLLTPFADIDAQTHACAHLLADDARRSLLGDNARELVLERYSVERMAEELEHIYRRVSKTRAAGRAGDPAARELG